MRVRRFTVAAAAGLLVTDASASSTSFLLPPSPITAPVSAKVARNHNRRPRWADPLTDDLLWGGADDEVPLTAQSALKKPVRYSSKDWIYALKSLPSSTIFTRIQSHLLWNTVWAALIAGIYEYDPNLPDFPILPHTIMSSAVALLLVFRTNASYDRFWEARKLWGTLVNKSRELAYNAATYTEPRHHERFGKLISAFCASLKQHLQSIDDISELERFFTEQEMETLRKVGSPPLYILRMINLELRLALQDPIELVQERQREGLPTQQTMMLMQPLGMEGTTAGRIKVDSPAVVTDHNALWKELWFNPGYRASMEQVVGTLCDVLGACERIAKTPIPKSYSRHTSRFLTVFMATLPLILVTKLGLLTPLVMFVVGWAMFSIEEIGHFIEEPFDAVNKQLTLADMCATIQRDVEDILLKPPLQEFEGSYVSNPNFTPYQGSYLGHGWYSEDTEDPVYGDLQSEGLLGTVDYSDYKDTAPAVPSALPEFTIGSASRPPQ